MAPTLVQGRGRRSRRAEASPPDASPAAAHQFGHGEQVKVRRRSVVVDKDRAHEGVDPRTLAPIEADVTGVEGEIIGSAYASPDKGGEVCYPVQLKNQAVIGVPSGRLERGFDSRRMMVAGGGDPVYACGWAIAFGGAQVCVCGQHPLPGPAVAAAAGGVRRGRKPKNSR